jgi:putative FmdB family regulatory protein
MPVVDYRCNACGHEFKNLIFKGDDTPAVCPRCKGKKMQMKTEGGSFMANAGLGSLLAGVPKGPS